MIPFEAMIESQIDRTQELRRQAKLDAEVGENRSIGRIRSTLARLLRGWAGRLENDRSRSPYTA